jgi:uncharacterized membrane protein YqjE
MVSSHAPATAPSRPQLPAAGVALGLLSEAVAHRAELAAIELSEAREHATGSALLAAGTAALVLCTGFALTLLVASLVWDLPNRGWWLAGLCLAYLATAATAAFLLMRRLRTWRPLGEIQGQLQQDYQCLSLLIKSAAP